MRRGKHWIFFHQRFLADDIAVVKNTLFGGTTSPPADPPPPANPNYMAFTYHVNDYTEMNPDSSITVLSDDIKGDWWITRPWPDPECDNFFGEADETWEEWDRGVRQGGTILPTNCIQPDDEPDRNNDERVHPHQPCFVVRGLGDPDRQYGSVSYPYSCWWYTSVGLLLAIERHANYGCAVDVWIQPGSYAVPGGLTIDRPMRLVRWEGDEGAVVIE